MNIIQSIFTKDTRHTKVYVSPGIHIDVAALCKSNVNRYIVSMSVNEVLRHSPNIKDFVHRPDTTGGIIIVSSFGLVDGFQQLQYSINHKISLLNSTIFELRNAEYFMDSSLDIACQDRNKIGKYGNNSMIGSLRGGLDLSPYNHNYNHNVDKKIQR